MVRGEAREEALLRCRLALPPPVAQLEVRQEDRQALEIELAPLRDEWVPAKRQVHQG